MEEGSILFVFVKDAHAKDGDGQCHNGNDDDAHLDCHAPTAHGREDLTTNNAVNRRVSNHENDVKKSRQLGRPVSHKVTQDDLQGQC